MPTCPTCKRRCPRITRHGSLSAQIDAALVLAIWPDWRCELAKELRDAARVSTPNA